MLLPGSKLILEGGRFRAILIREGRSLNGNHWTKPVLEKIAQLAKGVPVNLYDFSAKADGRQLSHWEFIRRRLPPAIARMLPERLSDAQVMTIASAAVEDIDGRAAVIADLEAASAEKEGIVRRIINAARRMGKTVGLSIHVPPDAIEMKALDNGDTEPTDVTRIVGFDMVSVPSAGGRILPVLEALARRSTMSKWVKKLLRLVPEDKRAALEALIPEGAEIGSAKDLVVDEHQKLVDALIEALELPELEPDDLAPTLEALVRTVPEEKKPSKPKRTKKRSAKPARRRARPALEGDDDDDADDDPDDDDAVDPAALRGDVDELLLQSGRDVVEAVVEAAELPGEMPAFARRHLSAILEAQGRIDRKTAKEFVDSLKKSLGKSQSSGGGLLEGDDEVRTPYFSQDWSNGERAEVALEALIAREQFGILLDDGGKKTKVPAFKSIKHAYQVITGDVLCEGRDFLLRSRRPSQVLESYPWEKNPYMQLYLKATGVGLEAAITTTGFADILTNVINKRLAKEYAQLAHLWRMIAVTETVTDFKSRDIHRLGEYGDLPTVAENGNYLDLALPTEEKASAQIAKRGGLAPITWESILNDDTRSFRGIPGKLARAAERTLNSQVWGKLLNNTAWGEDATAVFHANHSNLISAAYSFANLELARRSMTKQKDMDSREAGRVKAKNVFCGPNKYDEVWTDLFSDRRPVLVDTDSNEASPTAQTITRQNPNVPNALRARESWDLWEVHEFDEVTGREDDVMVAASVQATEIMEVGFLNGNETPEIFIQDLPRVGSFFDADRITYKVRHVHDDGVLVDYRGVQLIDAP